MYAESGTCGERNPSDERCWKIAGANLIPKRTRKVRRPTLPLTPKHQTQTKQPYRPLPIPDQATRT